MMTIPAPTRLLAMLASGLLLLTAPAASGTDAPNLASCAAIENDVERLRCYDELSQKATEPGVLPAPVEAASVPVEAASVPVEAPSPMQERWELVQTSRRTLFTVKPHHPTYVLPVRYTDSPNSAPYLQLDPDDPSEAIDEIEVKFQLSFKLKAVDRLFGNHGDVWVGYTQQSHWQVYNQDISSPFRETNYEPEAMLVFRTPWKLFGIEGRFVNFGVVHQSNGRSDPLSRSWNRVYVQLFDGYGESMIDYDHKQTTIGAGVLVTDWV